MDYNNYSNPRSYPSNEPKIIGTPKQITVFCYFLPYVVSGVLLALLAFGVFDLIIEDPTSKIMIGVFAGIWNFNVFLIIIGILITNSPWKKILKTPNLYDPSQSYPNEMDQSSQYQGHSNPQSSEMNISKKEMFMFMFMMDFIIAGMLFILLAIGVFLILYAVGVFDFSPTEFMFKIVLVVFAGIWNFLIFLGLIQIIRYTGLIKLSRCKSNKIDNHYN